jgi:hypothetical protein
MAKPAFGVPGPINALENFASETTNTFSRIRNSIKANENMFLFGTPTPDILTIVMKLYHENIVRNLCYSDKPSLSKGNKRLTRSPGFTNADGKSGTLKNIPEPQKFMCGIIEIDGELYITISESPKLDDGPIEDPDFDKKEATLFSLLNHTNINVEMPEEMTRNSKLKNNIRWRNFTNEKPSASILTPEGVVATKGIMFVNEGDKNYDSNLWGHKLSVNFVNSYDYLNNRLAGYAFPPFKKYKEDTQFIECVNGSACCEAKLFSYVYNVLGKTFDDITGFAVFWVGNELVPNHIIKNYCYNIDNPKLYDITSNCLSIMPNPMKSYLQSKYPGTFDSIMLFIIQQLSLPCPGCFANYNNFKTGTYKAWNPKNCYRHLDARTLKSLRRSEPQFSFSRTGSPSLPTLPSSPAGFSGSPIAFSGSPIAFSGSPVPFAPSPVHLSGGKKTRKRRTNSYNVSSKYHS